MVLPFSVPDWIPAWVALLLLALAAVIGLAFLGMPFAVYGLKSRLAALDARLDEVQGEIRSLSLRLPERHDAIRDGDADPYDAPAIERAARTVAPSPDAAPRRPPIVRPPIPPARYAAPARFDEEPPEPPPLRVPRRPEADAPRSVRPRTEPRFDPRGR